MFLRNHTQLTQSHYVGSITQTEKFLNGPTLLDLGYRDYIAARFLLNNKFIIQGLTLASTALEKYLKSLIVLTSKEK